jgi:hypothetical protein
MVEATPNIWHISKLQLDQRLSVCKACVIMCLSETGVKLDPAEFDALVQLCRMSCDLTESPLEGLEIKTFGSYTMFPTLWQWNACHFKVPNNGSCQFPRNAGSLIERLFISNFLNLVGINDIFTSR